MIIGTLRKLGLISLGLGDRKEGCTVLGILCSSIFYAFSFEWTMVPLVGKLINMIHQ